MAKRKKKVTRGGVRKGAGRPPGEETKRVRVPLSKLDEVMAIIKSTDHGDNS